MAKTKKIVSLVMFEIFFLSLFLLPVFARAFDFGIDLEFGSGGSGDVTSGLSGVDLPEGSIFDILKNGMQWLLAIFGILCIVAFVISGIQYLTSAGDEDMLKTAKRNMTWSIVGVIVGLSGMVVLQAIQTWLEGSNSEF
jgi:hypothetical protein